MKNCRVHPTYRLISTQVSIIAFVLFISELTNEVYGYEVVDLHAWEKDEGETNAFAAPGRSGAMVIPQDVLELRAARVKTMRQKQSARAADE